MTHNVQLYPTKEMMAIVQKSGSIVPEKKKLYCVLQKAWKIKFAVAWLNFFG